HVDFAHEAVGRVREINRMRPVRYLCDPVLGDDLKGLYIAQSAAEALRDRLIGIADIATPNRFELSYLAMASTRVEVRSARNAAAADIGCPFVVATSVPSENGGETINVLRSGASTRMTRVPLREAAPHGTGDLFSALLLAELMESGNAEAALGFATAGVDATLAASTGSDMLSLAALISKPHHRANWTVEELRG
ncbi:MAG: bifunctional hydroxymethylpyrimidine kinase/phosphomethylpyrimidine kinase, partial [Gammaproteobacteria bacterium]